MSWMERRPAWPAALVSALAIIAIACTRSPALSLGATSKLERANLRVGIPAHTANHLPLYLAAERTAREEGLSIEVLNFGGTAGMVQGLASDSLDVAVHSLDTLIDMLSAGQEVRGFYGGVSQSGLEWFVRPEIRSWADLKGQSVGISSHASLISRLTRHALRKHGLDPDRDVQQVQVGGSPTAYQALAAGRIAMALLSPPFKWQAEAEGFVRLGTQATEIAEEWPSNILVAKERFLDEHPNTLRALLRAQVRAIRLAQADRQVAGQTLVHVLKLEPRYATRAVDEAVPKLNERGTLPASSMPVFWEIVMATDEVAEPWPEARFFDRRFVDTFDEWAPR